MTPKTLFDSHRLSMLESMELTVQSLAAYGPRHDHWAIAWSGGKDSSALLTLVVYLIRAGRVQAPKRLTILYADTRMELPPLSIAAMAMIEKLKALGIEVRIVLPPLDDRFFVYMFGRGVPPPSNTFRWCTPQIKVEPMQRELQALTAGTGGKVLMLTGVRQGESAMRDGRIAMSCGKDGAECGQGWYQTAMPEQLCATLAPLLHWRVCHVWDWLRFYAPGEEYGAWPTAIIADAYGGDEAEEINARTGCIGCPLASRDNALETLMRDTKWQYLSPLLELKPLYRELKLPIHRKRKAGGERNADGSLAANQHRMGPLKMESRLVGMYRVLRIQARVNVEAHRFGRPIIDILNDAEVNRINELIEANTWPNKWSESDPDAELPFEEQTETALFWPTINGASA